VSKFFSKKGPDLKKTHKVQSHRGLVERIIRRVKEFSSVQGMVIESIEKFEMLLDNVCAQHNLKELSRQQLLGLIPKVAPHAPDAHIFTMDLEPSLKIPREVALNSGRVPLHLKQFHEELKSIVPQLQMILAGAGREACFTTRVLARGRNLFEGANVLQVAVQDEGRAFHAEVQCRCVYEESCVQMLCAIEEGPWSDTAGV
jgi:hypothetical protein